MKITWKTLLSTTIGLMLCMSLSTSAFASQPESQDNSSIMGLLESLVSITTEEEETIYGDDLPEGVYAVGNVAFAVPGIVEEMEEDEGSLYLMVADKSETLLIAAQYIEANGEDISLLNEENQKEFIDQIARDTDDPVDYVMTIVNGYNSMELVYTQEIEGSLMDCRGLVMELNDALFLLSVMSFDSSSYLRSGFDFIEGSIRTDGEVPTAIWSAKKTDTTETASPEQNGVSAAGIVVADNDLFTMIITGEPYYPESAHLFLPIYIENHSDATLWFDVSFYNSAVNGYEITTYIMNDVLSPRETVNTNLCWDTRLLEENGIDNINTIDLDLLVDNDEERSVTEPLFHEMIPISLAENPGSFSS